MKRVFRIIAVLCLIHPLVVSAGLAMAVERPMRVLGDHVNVRAKPVSGAPVLFKLMKTDLVSELGRDKDWVHIQLSGQAGKQGWVHQSLLEAINKPKQAPPPATAPAATPAPSPQQVADQPEPAEKLLQVQGNRVNVRAEPSAGAEVLFQLLRGDRVSALSREGDWIQIRLPRQPDQQGWIHASLLEPSAVIASGPVQSEEAAFNDFQARFQSINRSTGNYFFREVRYIGNRTIQLLATDAWMQSEPKVQQSTLESVTRIWSSFAGSDQIVNAEVVDPSGVPQMRYTY